jgi:three-Cys-motif partner protein
MQTQWKIEPHTIAKHEILQRYLGAWYPILSSSSSTVTYIDGFCGPGRYEKGEDGSPIIALREALEQSQLFQNKQIKFLFIDERVDRIAHLESELNQWKIPTNFDVQCKTGQFDRILEKLLDDHQQQNLNLAPTFAFIDPFGFKGIPFDLVCRLLQNPKTEVFINIMVDAINRFLEHPDSQTRQHIIDLFGTSKVLNVAQKGSNRITALRVLYQKQLRRCAKFVRYFEMRDDRGKVIYYLFFATNHRLGHARMKEAFWKVDPSSGFKFSDRTNPDQLILLDLDPATELAEELMNLYKGTQVCVRDIRLNVEDKTPFEVKHMRSALILLENDIRVNVKRYKSNGKIRRKGTFPDRVIVEFGVDSL